MSPGPSLGLIMSALLQPQETNSHRGVLREFIGKLEFRCAPGSPLPVKCAVQHRGSLRASLPENTPAFSAQRGVNHSHWSCLLPLCLGGEAAASRCSERGWPRHLCNGTLRLIQYSRILRWDWVRRDIE